MSASQEGEWPERPLRFALWIVLGALAVVSLWRPELIGQRFAFDPQDGIELKTLRAAARSVAAHLWAPFLAVALLLFVGRSAEGETGWSRGRLALAVALALGAFLTLTQVLADWIVDDAGITFAYAKNFAEGHGLVVRPDYPAEEGYSNTFWLLILAGTHAVGMDMAVAAKVLSVGLGAAALALALVASARLLGPRLNAETFVLCVCLLLGAPFIVWTSSGLEHSLQALLFLLVATSPMLVARPEMLAGAALSILVLTRPEAPLPTAAATFAWLGILLRDREAGVVRRVAWIVVPPLSAFVGLYLFRMAYFSDPFSNPFYVKAHGLKPWRVFNLPGSGWRYVLDWASSSGALVLVPTLLLGLRWKGAPRTVTLALAVLIGQATFVVSATGDWMGEFRFVAPCLPLLAILVAYGAGELQTHLGRRQRWVALASALVLSLYGTIALVHFRAAPTTPFERIGRIGLEFRSLAERLGVERPSLGHHDAGGTSYTAELDIVDLAGLCDRNIAKNVENPAFLRDYLLDEKRPTFFFGVTTYFAALWSRFHQDPRFLRDYVPVVFTGKEHMQSGLCHVRRELVREGPGLVVEREGDTIRRLVVEAPGGAN